jgi:hypothetical protein
LRNIIKKAEFFCLISGIHSESSQYTAVIAILRQTKSNQGY